MVKSFKERREVAKRRALDVLPEAERRPFSNWAVKPRQCGECQACCYGMRIDAFNKPSYTTCQHQCSAGCAIYSTKPAECNHYACAYVLGLMTGGEEMRPDNLGLIVDLRPSIDQNGNELGDAEVLICIREVVPGAATSDRGWRLIEGLADLGRNLILVPFNAPEIDDGKRSIHFRLQTGSLSQAPPGLFDGPPGDHRERVRRESAKFLKNSC